MEDILKIHHLNCGTLSPKYPRLQSIVYCLLVETDDGLVLVDTSRLLEPQPHDGWILVVDGRAR